MSEIAPTKGQNIAQGAARRFTKRDSSLLALYILVCGSVASAAEPTPPANLKTDAPAFGPATVSSILATPFSTAERFELHAPAFSETEFRPRQHSILETEPLQPLNVAFDEPTLRTQTWQHVNEFKSQDRLRLLTLWQTRGSSLSLQTKRGGPSLQWSSPWMHDHTSRGLFDQLLSVPARGFAPLPHSMITHSSAPVSNVKSSDIGPVK